MAFSARDLNSATSDGFGSSEDETEKRTKQRRSFYRKKGGGASGIIRECARCKTRETPMWRSGPQGKGTLCNACGVKWSLAKHAKRPTTREPRRRGTVSVKDFEGSRPERRSATRKSKRAVAEFDDEEEEESDQQPNDTPENSARSATNTDADDHPEESRGERENVQDNNEDFYKEGQYHCKYCQKTWPLESFRNGQQFGAHCSNCSRRKRKVPSSVSSRRKDKKFIQKRTLARQAERERLRAAGILTSEASSEDLCENDNAHLQNGKRRRFDTDRSSDETDGTSSIHVNRNGMSHSALHSDRRLGHEGDLACAESIEGDGEGAKSHAYSVQNGAYGVKTEQRRGRSTNKGKEKLRHGDEENEEEEDNEDDMEDEEEEEEEDWDEDGFDRRFFERLEGPAKGLLAGVEEELHERQYEHDQNMLNRGLNLLKKEFKTKQEQHKKERKKAKTHVLQEVHDMKHQFEYSVEIMKARLGSQLKVSDEQERSALDAFAKQIEQMVGNLQHERDQICAIATTQRAQNQLMSQLEQVTRLFSHECEAGLEAIRREGGDAGRNCFAELDRVDKAFHSNLTAKEEEWRKFFQAAKGNFKLSYEGIQKGIEEVENAK